MKQLITNRRAIIQISKGLLFLPFFINPLSATESGSSQEHLVFEESHTFETTKTIDEANSSATDCPRGFNHSGILNVCVAEDLTLNVVTELSSDNRCLRNYEKMVGTKFCTQKNHFLSANKSFYLIGGEFGSYCPENYSRPPESDICVEKRLSLIELHSELALVAPTDGTGVPPDEATGLFAAPPLECDPGFIKPPGFHFCIANTLASNAEPEQYEFEIPVGKCPANWSRKIVDGFCLPENYLHVCGIDFPCKVEPGDSFRILKEPLSCPEGFTYQHINIPTHDHSTVGSFTLLPVYACVPPDKFDE
ncbi:MAG: hypothetical protein OQJ89_14185 [Kangiellaceae bacterium]|nr:hypothetical protein [Kangiellaceae bacterium]MCW8998590.1 hypothetical protein [Kangiellaceae bacterium]MCW9018116.1 hypothetical protein [Kangiellaceae bacterium]